MTLSERNVVIISCGGVVTLTLLGVLIFVLCRYLRRGRQSTKRKVNPSSSMPLPMGLESQNYYEFDQSSSKSVSETKPLLSDPHIGQPPIHASSKDLRELQIGWLKLSCAFEIQEQRLFVQLIMMEFPNAKEFSKRDCLTYLSACILPNVSNITWESRVKKVSKVVALGDQFYFAVKREDLLACSMKINVFAFDDQFSHVTLGEILYSLSIMESQKITDGRTSVTASVITQTRVRADDVGEVLLSLCYKPTSGRLEVFVVRARRCQPLIKGHQSNCAFRVSLMAGLTVLRSYRTKTCSGDSEPVFNQQFIFDVPHDEVHENSVVIHMEHPAESNGTTVRTGLAEIGARSPFILGRKHWQKVIQRPRDRVYQWQSLSPVTQL